MNYDKAKMVYNLSRAYRQRERYSEKKKEGICIYSTCSKKANEGVYCEFHRKLNKKNYDKRKWQDQENQ